MGVVGVGWDLSHRMIRVSNDSGGGAWQSDLLHGAETSIEAGDRVANVSYSGCDSSSNLTTATYIKSIGGLLVWSAGNDGRWLSMNDRDADDMIVVGATDSGDNHVSWSAYGPFVDLVAPGEYVYTCDADHNSDYASVSGTSFSAPLTAGLCALVFSADPSQTPDQVETVLKTSCDDLGSGGVDNTYGYGRIDTYGAMNMVGAADPLADFTANPRSGYEDLSVDFTDLSSGTGISAWDWDFGDTGSSSSANPTHVYVSPGTYTVSLSVTGTNGNDTMTKDDYIVVTENPLDDFIGSPTSGFEDLQVSFTDLSVGTGFTNWLWDFGDTGTSTQRHPVYVYVDPGTYTVSLSVTSSGGTDTETKPNYITVMDAADAGFVYYNGTDFNPFIFTSNNLPVLGTNWVTQIDGGAIGASGLTFAVAYAAPFAFMTGIGELLVDVSSPWMLTHISGGGAGISTHTILLPNDPGLAGIHAYTQGLCNNVGGVAVLTNAIDATLGY